MKTRSIQISLSTIAGEAFIASSALVNAASNVLEADKSLDETIQIVVARRKIFLDPATDMFEAMAAESAAADAIKNRLRLVMADDTVHNILSAALFYKFVVEDTPANAFWEHDPDFDNGYDDPADPDDP